MRARGRGRGRGGGKGRGRMRGQGTRGTRRGGRTARSVQANPVDDKWKWLSTYANDSSISSPVLMLKVDHLLKLSIVIALETFSVFSLPMSWWTPPSKIRRCILPKRAIVLVLVVKRVLAYLGMNIAMGIVDLPEHTDYWTQEPMLRSPWFPCVMSLKHFKAISQLLHFADNALALSRDNPSYDRLWKIRPVIRQSQKAYTPGKCVSVDESMIGTRSCLSFIQYVPKKPTKWGIKVGCALSQLQVTYTNFKCTLARTLSAQMD